MGDRRTLAVVYDRGAASAGEIAVGLRDLGSIAFLVADSEHAIRLQSVLAGLGQVVPLSGDGDADLARVRTLAPSAILTFSEPMLPTTAYLAAALGLPFHSVQTTRLLTDKIQQRDRLRARGVDDVRSRPISSPDEWPQARAHVGLPAVIKPVHGEGSRNTYLVDDDETARQLLPAVFAALRPSCLLVEELLRGRPSGRLGDYVSVESLCGPQGITHLAVTGKFPLAPPFREGGQFWPARLSAIERAEVTELATRALNALEVTIGITHTEIKLTEQGPRIIEINGRLGGHVNRLAHQACRTDLVRVAALLALGASPSIGLLPFDKVYFQHNSLAPTAPCRLVGIHGAAAVRRVPGVAGFRAYARVGDRLPGDVMTHHLDLLWGDCADYDSMTGILDDALSRLSYEFQFENGWRRITAAALRG